MKRKISVRDLKPGMFVVGMPHTPLLKAQRIYAKEGYVRSSEEVLAIARKGYREVFIDLRSALSCKGARTDCTESAGQSLALEQELERLPDGGGNTFVTAVDDSEGERLREEIDQARELYGRTLVVARELFTQAAQGRRLALDAAVETMGVVLDGVRDDPAAILWASLLEDGGARLHTHSVNVSVLAATFGQHLGLARKDVVQLGLAGLLHDLGQTRLPMELTGKRADLTPQEQRLFSAHPLEGEALLRRQGGLPESVLRAVREHHEQHDGKGYPHRVAAMERSLFGRILALADRFDSLSHPGGHAFEASPAHAVTLLYAGRGTVHCYEDLERFIRFIGVYPLGSLVRLSDGRSGMVWRHDPEHPLAPLINVVLDQQQRPIRPERVNLAAVEAADLRVQKAINPEQFGIPAQRLSPSCH